MDGTENAEVERSELRENATEIAGETDRSVSDLRRVIDTIPALVWCARPDGSMEFLNKQWHDYTGLSPAETMGWGYQAAFHPEDCKNGIERCRKLFSGNGPAESEIRLRRCDGVYRWFLIRVEPLRDETGQIIRWYGTSTDIEALKQTEERLREDERELRRIIDAIPQTIVVQDPAGAPLYANRATLDYTGLAMEDVTKPGFRERIFHPDDIQRLAEDRQFGLARDVPFQLEQRALGKDGHYRWFLIQYNPLLDERGNVIRWYATGTDIEHRKQAENKLRQEGRELRQLIDFLPQHVLVLDKDGNLLQANKMMLDYNGFTLEEMKGEARERDVHPDDLERARAKRRAGLSRGMPFEVEKRLLGKDGQFRWFLFRFNPVLDEGGDIARWFATATDIEDRKQAENKLREDEQELRQLIDFLPEHVIVLDKQGALLQANKTMLEYLGYSLDEMKSGGDQQRISRDVHPEDLERTQRERKAALSKGVPFEMDKRLRSKDGQFRWFLFRYRPVLNGDGQVVRWFVAATDIEDRKQAEDRMRNEAVTLREDIVHSSMFEEIVGSSQSLRKVLKTVDKVAATDSTVLILGETGTGKELIARAIHKRSPRSSRAFIRVNCAAIPSELIASELFGHEKGAFTGALERRIGRFEAADGGTLFLDEIGDLPAGTQITLLRVLQEHEFERIGSTKPVQVDVRVLAATNRDIAADVDEGLFRRDLYYRLNVFPVDVPPLRERIEDIPLLAEYLVQRYSKKAGKKIASIDRLTLEMLQNYDWPGNVRELQNVIERAVILCETPVLYVDETWFRREASRAGQPIPLNAAVDTSEREMIERALLESAGRVGGIKGAAAKLGLPRQTLESKIKTLGINKFRFRRP